MDVFGTKMAISGPYLAISGFTRAPEEPYLTIFNVSENSYVYRGTFVCTVVHARGRGQNMTRFETNYGRSRHENGHNSNKTGHIPPRRSQPLNMREDPGSMVLGDWTRTLGPWPACQGHASQGRSRQSKPTRGRWKHDGRSLDADLGSVARVMTSCLHRRSP